MKVKELIEELSKYDGELEVEVYKIPVRKKYLDVFKIKRISPCKKKETREITSICIGF